ncbi:MAG: ABC transporter ATP-binding protein [Firmicutes bacterium]|nr:ABC transporter ATP-binding protein [Bacillota bacterium]
MKTNQPLFTKTSLVAHFLQGCKRFFILSILMSFLNTLMEMLIPQVIRRFVDSVIGDDPLNLPAFAEAWLARLAAPSSSQVYLRGHMYLVAILIGILALLVAFAFYGTHQSNAIAAEKLHKNIREELFAHIQKLPFAWHMKNKTGDIIQRCTSDAERVRIFIAEQMVSVVRIVIMMGLSLYFMFSMDWRLSLVAACAIPVIVGYSAFFHAKIGGSFEKCDENEGILSTIAQENLTGVRVVRAFGREEFERKRFEKQNVYYTGLWISLMKLMAVFWGIGDFISGLQVLLILVLGSVFCVRGTLSAGEFIAFLSYNMMLIWPVRQLGRVISEMSKAGVSLDRIMYIMNSPVEKDRDNAVSREETDKALKGDIVFENVNFGYEPDIPIVSDINLTIPAGSTFGILGSTGSGKSTLMHLLNRLYELPEENGKITIGGVDIADMKAEDLRRNIGMVLQEPFLFSRTISENISITNRNMTMEEIRKAAKIACVDEAIKEFKNGYDTVVGERGVTLSGGQKQRTAIARMLTSRAPVMVFDDSLSAVDAETDARIRHALSESLGDSTVILISHRITTLMQADQIMVLDKGRIVEMGTPDELLEKNGIYKKIYDMQLSLSEDETA